MSEKKHMKKNERYFLTKNFIRCTGVFFILVVLSFHNGFAQSITISPSSSSSIQTSRSLNNIDLIKTGANNTSGFRFYQNASLKGGLFYSDNENVINLSHTPGTSGILWNANSQRAGIGVQIPEGRLHILNNSTDTFPQLLLQENNNTDGARINFENFGVANKRWTLYGRNSNAALLSENVFNIYHTSFGNVAQFTGDGNTRMNGSVDVSGFTKLGADAPKIKVRKYTGVLDNDNYSSFAINIPLDKIVTYTGHVVGLDPNPYPQLVKPHSEENNHNYNLQIINTLGLVLVVFDRVPSDLRERPYTVYITYEE